jgi:ComF family protein
LIFPSRCIGCRASGGNLCAACLSGARTAERELPEWIASIFDYRDPLIKKAVWLLKYKGKKQIAEVFAGAAHDALVEQMAELKALQNFTEPLLVPIPLSSRRMRERGFNQSELIAKHIIASDTEKNLRLENNALKKIKDTENQARMKDRRRRLENLKDCFIANPDLVNKRNIILIDDVTTTGATLTEAKKALKSAGAKKIIALTIAH